MQIVNIAGDDVRTWDNLIAACQTCQKCGLCETRNNIVIGDGNREASIMLIGEAPGYYEDKQGLPFVGAAGNLLDKMLAAISLTRENVYIANILKCRPPDNRDPENHEIERCINYLKYQILLVRPKIIVCLGRISAKTIIDPNFSITRNRGVWYERNGYSIIATYHPSALLRDESKKRPAWEDMKAIRARYDEIKDK